jgi:nucleoid-associated protein YgaU
VLVLAVAGGAWALFGRDNGNDADTTASAPRATAPQHPAGPVVPGKTALPVSPTSTGPAAATATQSAATTSPKPAPTKALVTSPSAAPKPTASPRPTATPAKPATPVTGPQQGGTVTKKAFTFHVARGDTLWDLTEKALRSTGRSTSNASIAAHVAKFYEANRSTIGSDPNLILVGSTLTWPASL